MLVQNIFSIFTLLAKVLLLRLFLLLLLLIIPDMFLPVQACKNREVLKEDPGPNVALYHSLQQRTPTYGLEVANDFIYFP